MYRVEIPPQSQSIVSIEEGLELEAVPISIVVHQNKLILSEWSASLRSAICGYIPEDLYLGSLSEVSPERRRLDEMPTWI